MSTFDLNVNQRIGGASGRIWREPGLRDPQVFAPEAPLSSPTCAMMGHWRPPNRIDSPLTGCARTAQWLRFLALFAPSRLPLFGTDDALYNGEECPGSALQGQPIGNPVPRMRRRWTRSGGRTTIRHSELN